MQKSVLLSKHLWLSGQVHLWLCSLNSMAWRSSGTHGASFPGRSSHTVCLSSVASWCSMMLHDVPSHPFTKSSKRPAANPSAASLVGCQPRIVNPKYISKGTYLLKENPCEDSLLHHSSFLGALGIDHFTRLFPAWKSVDLKQPARDKGPDPFQIHPIHFLIQIHPNNVSQRIGWGPPYGAIYGAICGAISGPSGTWTLDTWPISSHWGGLNILFCIAIHCVDALQTHPRYHRCIDTLW